MQSGISASQELYSDFNTLLSSDTHFGLLATISNESLVPVTFLTPTSASASFADNVDNVLAPHLKPNVALYIILRRFSTVPNLSGITYVPDAAPVRQKMLFASTRLTLARELGTEHFSETFLVTTPEELSSRGFQRHDAHLRLEAPLTEEERTLGEVKRAEAEAGSGTGTREIHLSQTLAMPVEDAAIEALKGLGGVSGNLVMLRINPETEVVELVPSSSSPSSISELVSAISTTEARFTFYKFTHSYGGNHSSPVLFFFTNPPASGMKAIKSRMLYPLMKRSVLTIATDTAGLQIERKFELEDPTEITEDSVLGELHPRVQVRQGFSRPKRPGR